jgi:hypothetical protein
MRRHPVKRLVLAATALAAAASLAAQTPAPPRESQELWQCPQMGHRVR